MLFEDLGFTYMGPVDGHDIEKLEEILKISKKIEGPKVIHILTRKGMGYKPAEESPDKFHGVSSFDLKTGKSLKPKKDDYSKIFGQKLLRMAKKDKNIVAVCAAMKTGTGLVEFADQYPKRFFDVGIAEQHALTFAAGLAKEGLKPFVAIYSSFYQRAYDQVIHDIAIQKLPVVMCVDRAGQVGNDGETHQGLLDLSFFNVVPNLTIMAPKDFKELEAMMEFASEINKPVVIRYPRGGEGSIEFTKHPIIEEGKSELVCSGKDVSIIAIGNMVERALELKNKLDKDGIKAEVINVRFLKPLDKEAILKSIQKTNKVVTIEDNVLTGGLATSIKELILDNNLNVELKSFGYPDEFIKQGSPAEVEKKYHMDIDSIYDEIKKMNF